MKKIIEVTSTNLESELIKVFSIGKDESRINILVDINSKAYTALLTLYYYLTKNSDPKTENVVEKIYGGKPPEYILKRDIKWILVYILDRCPGNLCEKWISKKGFVREYCLLGQKILIKVKNYDINYIRGLIDRITNDMNENSSYEDVNLEELRGVDVKDLLTF